MLIQKADVRVVPLAYSRQMISRNAEGGVIDPGLAQRSEPISVIRSCFAKLFHSLLEISPNSAKFASASP